jgi:hypothetical protein
VSPGRIGFGVGVAISIRLANGRNRPPIVVVVLGVKGADVAVGEGEVEEPKEPRVLPQSDPYSGRDCACDAIPLQVRTSQPEESDLGLIRCANARGSDPITAEAFDLIVIGRVPHKNKIFSRKHLTGSPRSRFKLYLER